MLGLMTTREHRRIVEQVWQQISAELLQAAVRHTRAVAKWSVEDFLAFQQAGRNRNRD